MEHSVFQAIKDNRKDLINNVTISTEKDVLSENYKFGNSIYNLFDALCKLFVDLNLISNSEKDKKDKFKFIHAYPDSVTEDEQNVVTYNIVRRAPRVTANSSISTRPITKMKPSSVGESYNTVTGNVDEYYKVELDNIISITIFSSKARVLNNLSRIIESIFLRYSSYIKKSVDECIYLGMSDIRYLDRTDEHNPVYSRELQFKVLTTELYKLELEQAKSIEIQL